MESINYDFNRSVDSELATAYFFEKEYMGFVEGKGDILYWAKKLEEYNINNIYLKELTGKKNINKELEELLKNEELKFIFLDRDYDEIFEGISKDNQIIYTYGYSIENTFCCIKSLLKFILECKTIQNSEKEKIRKIEKNINEFLEKVEKEVIELLIFDILNEKKSGQENYNATSFVPVNSYAEFFKDNFDWKSEAIRQNLFEFAQCNFSQEEIKELKEFFTSRDWKKYIKGHFLNSIFLLIFKKFVKGSITLEIFNNMLIEKCKNCDDKYCTKKIYYKEQLEKMKVLIEKDKSK